MSDLQTDAFQAAVISNHYLRLRLDLGLAWRKGIRDHVKQLVARIFQPRDSANNALKTGKPERLTSVPTHASEDITHVGKSIVHSTYELILSALIHSGDTEASKFKQLG